MARRPKAAADQRATPRSAVMLSSMIALAAVAHRLRNSPRQRRMHRHLTPPSTPTFGRDSNGQLDLIDSPGNRRSRTSRLYDRVLWCTSMRAMRTTRARPLPTDARRLGYSRVDATQDSALAQQYRIQNLPTVVILHQRREVDRIVGAVPYEQLHSRFARAAARGQSSSGTALARAQSNAAEPTAAPPMASPAASSLVVRGQSPAAAGFPLLAAGSLASSASSQSTG